MADARVLDTLLALARKLALRNPAAFRQFMAEISKMKPEVGKISNK